MIITQQIKMDLKNRGSIPRVDAVQGDSNTRAVELSLYANNVAWPVPAGVSARVRYRKSDGTGGIYDTLPDGTTACVIADNVITFTLAPQMLTAPGFVTFQVELIQEGKCLATFSVQLFVEQDPSADVLESENYVNLRQWLQAALEDELAQITDMIEGLPDVSAEIASHNFSGNAHMDIRSFIQNVNGSVNALGANKVSVADIVNNLVTGAVNKPLSAAQGMVLKALIDAIPAWAKEQQKPEYTPEEVGAAPEGHTHPQYIAANQGAVNAGKILMVGADGMLFLADMPSSGGDIPKYTNRIPVSTDTDGAVYNGVGYNNAMRLDDNCLPAPKENNYNGGVSGFIPCQTGDVIRIRGIDMIPSGDGSTRLVAFYDSAKTKLGGHTPYMLCSNGAGEYMTNFGGMRDIVYDGNHQITQFTISVFYSEVAYIRIGASGPLTDGNGFSKGCVVTVNEEIV